MTDAYIYDAVRTPRGKGRRDGSLHEVTPVRLAVTALQAIASRNKLDTHLVDDVVLGCRHARSASRAPTSRAPRR